MYIGSLYIRAAKIQNLVSRANVWYESACDIFAVTMSERRFWFLSRFFTFDDKIERGEKWKRAKFTCIREFFEEVNTNNARHRPPSVAIDETLYPYRGLIGFKQYNLSKLGKYGVFAMGKFNTPTTRTPENQS